MTLVANYYVCISGVIVEYNLYHNGLLVFTHPSVREYRVSGLLPYSLHIFRVSACTNQGCGFSDEVQGRTQESLPVGFVVLDLRVEGARNVGVKWSAPAITNGRIIYSVSVDGLFYVDPGNSCLNQ